jgi:hypothetical protein
MEVREYNAQKYRLPSDSEKAACKEKIAKLRKDGEKLVKGMFEFLDAQGGWLDFTYRFFPGEPCRSVRITHGEIVDLPMVLVKHLNNVYKKVRQMPAVISGSGKIPYTPVEKISRCRFTPMDMM